MLRSPARSKAAASVLLAALACAPLAPAARAAKLPSPDELVDALVNPPDIGYEGKLLIVHWYGKESRAEELRIYRAPNDRIRREFLLPDGTVSRVIISDGESEEVRLVKEKKILKGDAAKTYAKVMPPQTERELLEKNYETFVSSGEKVAGRPAWLLEFRPTVVGKPWQRFWIDAETKVILENKRFLPGKRFAELSRFTHFERKTPGDDLFQLDVGTGTPIIAKGLEPDFMSLEQLNEATGKNVNFPDELPGGFRFESADFLELGKQTVRHARYTDGLAIVSIFETDKPVRLPRQGTMIVYNPTQGPSSLRLSSVGKVLNWQRGRKHYTVMSDVSRELLLTIESKLK